ncbi:N-terminal phage integrase SAM-like domain-containing protein [Lactobacillus iners]|uniref:N-terminal phage integrase SAM-like domain-containing protein n=1 Tax=Lactobacillus iners TaxID=147802 RepID=UPI0001E99D8D|nr:N-terminal phage integrase SAM-like domain-containing protein [Lactobacillus iners]EFQ48144.1 toxin-antitoxin system, toxin component, PIN family [Lactobacillus iners LEAF 2053A-b]EFU78300.1 toxin-antitoxin system, toxin component, PIN family [Lactobacillus iners ATCC 55195]MBW8449970.1 Arm DNA-binding domain-containing protein [Lactobacillus iners]MCT7676344.1 N-terminal phage integrase SAM-like domain-containing protein [Lactobacillus iners]MCT7809529.1 N-terminal phage integrase SAM-like
MPRKTNLSIKEYTLKNGEKRYYFKISLGQNSNGKRIVTTRRGFKTYAEADQVYNQLARVKADDFVKQNQITINELYKIWFEGHKNVVKESSASLEPGLYKNHIEPYFGNQFINKIVVADLQKWADKTAIENDKKTKKQLEFFS